VGGGRGGIEAETAVEHFVEIAPAVAVAVGLSGIEVQLRLARIGQAIAIAIRIGAYQVEAERRQAILVAVVEAIAIAVACIGVAAQCLLALVADAVTVALG